MSDTTTPPFDPAALDAEPAAMPDVPTPDHTATEVSSDSEPPTEPQPDDGGATVHPFIRTREKVKGGKKEKGAKKEKVRGDVPPKRKGQLVAPLTTLYVSVGATVSAFDPVCGMAVLDNAEKCAESLDALAQRNEAVRRALYAMMETSAWGGVIAAHMPLLVMLAVHHGPRDVAEKFAPIATFVAPNSMMQMHAETVRPDAAAGA